VSAIASDLLHDKIVRPCGIRPTLTIYIFDTEMKIAALKFLQLIPVNYKFGVASKNRKPIPYESIQK